MKCAVPEDAFVTLAMFSQIDDMFSHHFAHRVSIARSSQPIARCLYPLPCPFEGVAEKICCHGVERSIAGKEFATLNHGLLSIRIEAPLASLSPTLVKLAVGIVPRTKSHSLFKIAHLRK